ncbi:hypothetical protein Tco_1345982 [Tanacetum coccineum]
MKERETTSSNKDSLRRFLEAKRSWFHPWDGVTMSTGLWGCLLGAGAWGTEARGGPPQTGRLCGSFDCGLRAWGAGF